MRLCCFLLLHSVSLKRSIDVHPNVYQQEQNLYLLGTHKTNNRGHHGKAIWTLPAERTKTGVAINIPLAAPAVECLRKLIELGCSSDYLLPARKRQERMLPHIHENTLNVALSKVRVNLGDMPRFVVHDFRRTARTHLSALGTIPHIAERCLNHKVQGVEGVEGIYDRHDYIDERREALTKWAAFLGCCETGKDWNVIPLRGKKKTA